MYIQNVALNGVCTMIFILIIFFVQQGRQGSDGDIFRGRAGQNYASLGRFLIEPRKVSLYFFQE